MAAPYDPAAAEVYAAFHDMPGASVVADDWNAMRAVRQAVEGRSGVRIVDLGCGGGVLTREVASMPETAVALGIDHSPGQLALARAVPRPANCDFTLGDLVAPGKGERCSPLAEVMGTFDLALMEFVTCHAATREEFEAMIRAAAHLLAPGGQLIAIEGHPRLDRAPLPPSDRYGILRRFLLPRGHVGVVPSFTRIRTTFVTPRGKLSVLDYFHDAHAWAAACAAAGLCGLTIRDVHAPPQPEAGFWDGYVRPDHPSGCAQTAVIRAFKAKCGASVGPGHPPGAS